MASHQSQTNPRLSSGQSIKALLKKNRDELPPQELDSILALALNRNTEYIYKNPDKQLNRATVRGFYKLLNKRLSGWSLAYLKGYKEFYNLKFLVSKYTLIPRPESELIVDEALKYIKNNHNVLDVGTGSGCLVLSIAKNFPKADYSACDLSIKALRVAKTNARKLGLKNKIKFIKSNLFSKIKNHTSTGSVPRKFDIVMANLPYLTPQEMQEPSIKKEPRSALLAGADGLSYYRKFLEQVPNFLNKKYLILLEINPTQKELIKKAVTKQLPKAKIIFLKDLANNIRVVKITE